MGVTENTPPASPGAARRARDEDVFQRLAGVASEQAPTGAVRVLSLKQRMSTGAAGGGTWLQCTHVAEGHVGAVSALAAVPNALYSGGVDRTVRGWDLNAGREAWRAWCGGGVGALTAGQGVTGHDSRVVIAAAGSAVRLFDTRSNAPVSTLWSSGATGSNAAVRGLESTVTAVSLADPHTLYTAAGDKLRLWDLRMLECVYKTWSGHTAAVMCMARVSLPDGDRLATGSRDHCVRVFDWTHVKGVWEASNRRLLEPPHYDGVQALVLRYSSAGGELLYSASRDSSLKCWRLSDNTLAHSVMNAHKGWVTGVVGVGGVHNAGGWIASCGRDQALRLWSPALRPAAPPAPLPDQPHALATCAATGSLFTAGSGGEVRAWRVLLEPNGRVRCYRILANR